MFEILIIILYRCKPCFKFNNQNVEQEQISAATMQIQIKPPAENAVIKCATFTTNNRYQERRCKCLFDFLYKIYNFLYNVFGVKGGRFSYLNNPMRKKY